MKLCPIRYALPALLILLLLAAAGCARTSPAVGTWTGSVGPTTASVTLNEDGTGTVAIPPVLPQQPLTWKEEEKKVSIQVAGNPGTAAAAPQGASAAPGGTGASVNLDGTISEDGKTMTVPFPAFSLTLTKQEAQK